MTMLLENDVPKLVSTNRADAKLPVLMYQFCPVTWSRALKRAPMAQPADPLAGSWASVPQPNMQPMPSRSTSTWGSADCLYHGALMIHLNKDFVHNRSLPDCSNATMAQETHTLCRQTDRGCSRPWDSCSADPCLSRPACALRTPCCAGRPAYRRISLRTLPGSSP